jgi:2-amino-4-hydroxy-6-hydroxymethyldihydropteridine diphosphokinase
MAEVFLSLGTNIGDKFHNLQTAVSKIDCLKGTKILKISSIYETEPVGYKEQDDFYNIVVKLETKLSPKELLLAVLDIENEMGRVRTIINGPRIIDIDMLTYENVTLNEPILTLPHKNMMMRAFVLVPLCEICDENKYKEALFGIDNSGVKKINGRQKLSFRLQSNNNNA